MPSSLTLTFRCATHPQHSGLFFQFPAAGKACPAKLKIGNPLVMMCKACRKHRLMA